MTLTDLVQPYVTQEKDIAWDDVHTSFNVSMESITNQSIEQLKSMWGKRSTWPML
jgi:hypothetical protein